jgi:hypothetical protein
MSNTFLIRLLGDERLIYFFLSFVALHEFVRWRLDTNAND